ncbi:class I SAM-dependent methyltransferase [Desulfovibrio inopinatus]|uniref:class I SAM-dependent methyltransferase n=1 Tax=Desulfovibrio inopinatus TaxID=102109 RepID=UPI0003FD4A70|nr:class I SAM-dependent methyltransferase [Desulfovibrio inopinatus]
MATYAISTLGFSKRLLAETITRGGIAIDATVGNGNDTAQLARLVGEQGLVYGFDIQKAALDKARERLQQEGTEHHVRLLQKGHEHLAETIDPGHVGCVQCVVFNLGFLPGSDESVITTPKTTLAALNASLSVLAIGGLISIICYTGHPGGAYEEQCVETWSAKLDFNQFRVLRYDVVNKPGAAIRLYAVEHCRVSSP